MKTLMLLALPASLLFAGVSPASAAAPQGQERARAAAPQGKDRARVAASQGQERARAAAPQGQGRARLAANAEGGQNAKRGGPRGPRPTPEAKFAALDANQDGVIARTEVEGKRLAQHFDRIDADRSGTITLVELQAAHAKFEGKRGSHRGGKRFAELDVNQDGALTPDEVAGRPLAERFASLDTDRNGALSHEEWKAGHPKKQRPANGTAT